MNNISTLQWILIGGALLLISFIVTAVKLWLDGRLPCWLAGHKKKYLAIRDRRMSAGSYNHEKCCHGYDWGSCCVKTGEQFANWSCPPGMLVSSPALPTIP